MGQFERFKEARRAAQQAALGRWIERTEQREQNKQQVAVAGIGAADSPQRNARFQLREATLAQARELRAIGRLPIGIERKMGPTLDIVSFPENETARKAGRPVARVVLLGGDGTQAEGIATAFLASPQLLMTNHHVFPSRSAAHGTGANFLFERSERGIETGVTFEIDPDAFYVADEALDVALVAVKPRSVDGHSLSEFGSITLIEATSKILIGQPVNIIQHPEGGPKQYAVAHNRLVDILAAGFLHYETDTLEGSSGSPAFSKSWELVALHHASIPEYRDGRVVADDGGFWEEGMPDDKVHWIANEGTRISAIVKFLAGLQLDDLAQQEMLSDLLKTTTDPVDDLLSLQGATAAPPPNVIASDSLTRLGVSTMAPNQFTFSGPVNIHVYAASQAAPVSSVQQVATDAQKLIAVEAPIRFDRDYQNREGYDPTFLDADNPDLQVPAPNVVSERLDEILTDRKGKPLVLKYHHFELAMNERRRLQIWSAANVDYAPERKHKGDRKSFGSDKWVPDPRIPAAAQIFDSEFYKPAGNIDRGHIVRREDNAWGDDETEIEFANSDTFHWTNCTPQHEAFNQSNPARNDAAYRGMKGLWGDFENYVQKGLGDEDTKACILAGPVLDKRDPSADFGAGAIQYPLNFWKVVVVAPQIDGMRVLRAYGFLLSQADVVERFGIEVFQPGRFRQHQVSLQRLSELTGVSFDDALHAADPLKGSGERIDIVDGSEIRGVRRKLRNGKESLGRANATPQEWPRQQDGSKLVAGKTAKATAPK